MVVIIANKLPDAVRGRLKLWFIEPKANVFISGIKDSVADKVIDEIQQYCNADTGLMIIHSLNRPPWFLLDRIGATDREIVSVSDLQLVQEVDTKVEKGV